MSPIRTLMFIALLLCHQPLTAAEPSHILIVVGPSDHPPGTHEVAACGRLLKHCLENMTNLPHVSAEVVSEWPSKAQLESAASIVFLGDTFPANRFPNSTRNLAELDIMMQRGAGIVCLHFATGLLGSDVTPEGDHPLLRWLGGYYANRSCPHHQSVARIIAAATIVPSAKEHPINRGADDFTIRDEPYFNNYFGPDDNHPAQNVTILATSMLPPEAPKCEPVAWCVERPEGGRGVAVVMPHFYRNWQNENLRRLILNGIVWSARQDVPTEGISTALPDLLEFQPKSVEPN